MMQRVNQGDEKAVGDDRTGSGSAGVVPDALLAGIAAQVPHDQEIRIEAHFVNDLQLELQALADFLIILVFTVAAFEPILA